MPQDDNERGAVILRAHEDASFLRVILQAVPAFVILIDADLRVVYINRMQPGFKLEEVIGRRVEDFTAPEYHQRQRDSITEALRTGEAQSFTLHGTNPDGSISHYESRAMPVTYGEHGRVVCVIAMDVTEHVARAAALRESEEKLRILVEATGIGLWSWDVATGKIEWSDRMREITGRDKPLPWADYTHAIVHPEDRERVEAATRVLESGESCYVVHRILRPDGSVRWVMPCGRSHRDAQGNVARLMGGLLDVTAQHQLEEHVRNAQKIDAVGALTAGVAHNFNNMLAVIVPALDLIMSDARDTQKQLLLDAAHAARRASELVTQLMTFAGQRHEGEHKVQDLSIIVGRAVSMCKRTFASQVSVELETTTSLHPVRCNAAAVEQVLVNLMINARDAVQLTRREQPRVRVELLEVTRLAPDAPMGPQRRYACIKVIDEGVGMSPHVKAHLFEPFFTTKSPGRGTGLGLATSYGIVRDHGGFIHFDSAQGEGTTASVFLPVEVSAEATDAASKGSATPAHRGTIFVIDDEPAVRNVVEEVLRISGHETFSASDPASLEKLFESGVKPHLILLDRSMPKLPIKVALAELRARLPNTPILFFTGQDVPADERALVEGVLYKPLSLGDLVEAVDRFLIPH